MTLCYKGGHEFPIEDEHGGFCEEHGVTWFPNRRRDPAQPPHPFTEALARQQGEQQDQPCAS